MATFTLPDSLSTLSTTDLTALEASAVQAFDEVNQIDPDDLTDANVADLERLAGDIQTIRTERANRATAAQARRDRAAAAAALVTLSTDEPDEGEIEAAVDEDDAEDDGDAVDEPATSDAEQQAAAIVVAAGQRRRTVPSVAGSKKTPVVRPRATNTAVVTAAADVPGFPNGSRITDIHSLATAFSNRSRGFPAGRVPDTYIRSGVASIARPVEDGLSDQNYPDHVELVNKAADETRLPGGSLVAAGGWCAPSETLYDLCTTESMDGLIDLPEFQVTRGGIRFTRGPAFEDIYADAGFILTEAQVIAGAVKPCSEIDCPPFEEVRMDVAGVCVKAPILTNVGYPELVSRWIEGTLVAQAHKESAEVIRRMVLTAGTPAVVTGGAGTGFDVLAALEWVGTSLRYKYRMSLALSLEIVLPVWVRGIIRADLAIRQGRDNINVADAEIDANFAARGIRVQWVYDWQPLVTSGGTPAADPCYAAVPATFDVLVYPAGTFSKGVADVISLDAVYDSTLLTTNMYTAVFAESGFMVVNRCFNACQITVPTCISGMVGGNLSACLDITGAGATP